MDVEALKAEQKRSELHVGGEEKKKGKNYGKKEAESSRSPKLMVHLSR